MTHELFKPIHPRARARHGIVTRVLRALARPRHTSYVCPSLKTVEAVAWAVRGYDVSWSEPRVVTSRHNGYESGYLDPASLSYAVYPDEPPHYGACRSHGVEPRGFVPQWMALAELRLRNWARDVRVSAKATNKEK
jgi:hypothetical protein